MLPFWMQEVDSFELSSIRISGLRKRSTGVAHDTSPTEGALEMDLPVVRAVSTIVVGAKLYVEGLLRKA